MNCRLIYNPNILLQQIKANFVSQLRSCSLVCGDVCSIILVCVKHFLDFNHCLPRITRVAQTLLLKPSSDTVSSWNLWLIDGCAEIVLCVYCEHCVCVHVHSFLPSRRNLQRLPVEMCSSCSSLTCI